MKGILFLSLLIFLTPSLAVSQPFQLPDGCQSWGQLKALQTAQMRIFKAGMFVRWGEVVLRSEFVSSPNRNAVNKDGTPANIPVIYTLKGDHK